MVKDGKTVFTFLSWYAMVPRLLISDFASRTFAFGMGIFHCFAEHHRGERANNGTENFDAPISSRQLAQLDFSGSTQAQIYTLLRLHNFAWNNQTAYRFIILLVDGVMRCKRMTFKRFMMWSHQSKPLRDLLQSFLFNFNYIKASLVWWCHLHAVESNFVIASSGTIKRRQY